MLGHQFKSASGHAPSGVQVFDGKLRAVATLHTQVGGKAFELPDKAYAHGGRFARQDQRGRHGHADDGHGGHDDHGDTTRTPRATVRFGVPVPATFVGPGGPPGRGTPLGGGVVVWLRHVTSRYGRCAEIL